MRIIFLLLLFCEPLIVNTQSFCATYKQHINVHLMDLPAMSEDRKAKLASMAQIFKLEYNIEISKYHFQEVISQKDAHIITRAANIVIYKDHNSNHRYFIDEGESDVIGYKLAFNQENQWNITDEKTIIGDFTCRKASRKNDTGNNITAYFTDEIKIPEGPFTYYGLPGLIIRVEFAQDIIELIDFQYTNPSELNLPENLNILTEKEFRKYMKKKESAIFR